jgi:hypothetical protein
MEGSLRFFPTTGKVNSYDQFEIINIDALFSGFDEENQHIPYIVIGDFYTKGKNAKMIPFIIYSNVDFKNNIVLDIIKSQTTYKIEKGKITVAEREFKKNIQSIKMSDNGFIGENIEFKTIEIIHVFFEINDVYDDPIKNDFYYGITKYPFKKKYTMYFVGWYHLNGPNGTAVEYDYDDIEANPIGNCVRCDNPSQFIEVSEHGSTYCSEECQIKFHKK